MKIQNKVTDVSKTTMSANDGHVLCEVVFSFSLNIEGPAPDKLPPRLLIREPVSATRAPLSTLSLLLLRPRVNAEPLSPKRRSKLARRFTTSGRPND